MKNANGSLSCVVCICIVHTLAVLPLQLCAQTASVTFNVDGSVDVKNRMLYLQTTALLDLQELYRVPSDPGAPQGIMMWTNSLFNPNAVQYGPDGRVEVRVFDYDDERRGKGALIYAATGTKSGWNEDAWDEHNSMFVDGAAVSEKVRALFDSRKINTTNIKVLSQFEGVGSQCVEPGTSGIFTYGFLNGLFFSFAEPLAVSVQAVGAHLIAAYAAHVAVTAAANAAHAAANLANTAASAQVIHKLPRMNPSMRFSTCMTTPSSPLGPSETR
ncbi:MAG: hypothetical protein HC859_05780 [Bacteroidia bacterium]|nr:hypothetical protein [Bacteroidia bacterium]